MSKLDEKLFDAVLYIGYKIEVVYPLNYKSIMLSPGISNRYFKQFHTHWFL